MRGIELFMEDKWVPWGRRKGQGAFQVGGQGSSRTQHGHHAFGELEKKRWTSLEQYLR